MKKPKKRMECCGYPLSIFFIVVNEFCERFSYYGMRAVLVLYFRYFLHWDDDFATTIYHTFVALCYLTPILGAIIADSWLGKFKTITYLSIVYTIGQVVMALSAIHDFTDYDKDGTPDNMTLHIALSMLGLIFIALGTGGIKPCVAAFGGDQFEDHQEKQRSTFFSIFYLSINAGSLLSTLITPILRAQECGFHTKQKCYPLAFGVPAALMVVALIVFIVGKGMYVVDEPKGNVLLKVMKCIGFAIKNRFKHRSKNFPKREHWMDWAEEKYDKLLIAQVKMVLKVMFLYIPLPMFWALFDQQGSRWTLQATTMDGDFGAFVIQPDQMQTVNPILIVIMVPIMDNLLYPLIKKCHLNFTPLRKITVGMLLAALAFVAAALLQIQIDNSLPSFPSPSETQVKYLNLQNSHLQVAVAGQEPFVVPSFQTSGEYMTYKKESFTVSVNGETAVTAEFRKGSRQTVSINAFGIHAILEDLSEKPLDGNNAIRFSNAHPTKLNITSKSFELDFISPFETSNYSLVAQGKALFTIRNMNGDACSCTMELGFGSAYTVVVPSNFTFGENCADYIIPIEDIPRNRIHMAWQIIQYFVLTCGEVVFSVTGLDFSYSQAPSNMKSVLQAGWLFTVAVGNIIVLIVAEAGTLPEQWTEYLLFASLLVAVSIIFSIMAYFYTYIDPAEIEAQFLEHEPEDKEKKALEMTRRDSVSSSHSKKSEGKQTKI
ncbi:solute carrier family 15 member 1-like [Myxocyprinus asiaticus]|uniref:solute carrier family 15 member 1-like n=1 Tax=Myxocyprinus asiaticus TaxID=70543 RepID=UPI0022229597|nr:solute carrier family 15 member 1-like [Myxocyprinus asiaticus]